MLATGGAITRGDCQFFSKPQPHVDNLRNSAEKRNDKVPYTLCFVIFVSKPGSMRLGGRLCRKCETHLCQLSVDPVGEGLLLNLLLFHC